MHDKTLIEFFNEKNSNPSIVNAFTLNIYIRLYKIASKLGSQQHDYFGVDFLSPENIERLSDSMVTSLALLYKVIESVVSLINDKEDRKISSHIKEALRIIHDEYNDPYQGVDTIAQRVHLNENYLSRLFKKEIGVSIIEYKSRLRLEKAKKLLGESTMSIKDICISSGFYNSNYFRTWFKDNTGLTPSQYREQFFSTLNSTHGNALGEVFLESEEKDQHR